MWSSYSRIGWVLVVGVLASCGGGGDDEPSTGNAGAPSAGAPAGGAGAGSSGMGGAGGSGGTGGAFMLCPAAMPVTCGGTTCPEVAANLAMLCVRNCCTASDQCGNHNAATMSTCMPPAAPSSCPSAMLPVVGTMVPGCCTTDASATCGIMDISGLFGGGCVPRCRAGALLGINTEISCDGATTTPCPTPMAGAGGMGGASGGAGGMGGAGGTTAAGTGGSGGSGAADGGTAGGGG